MKLGKDGTSKKTDIDFMNSLGITPNTLYKEFITNPELRRKIEIDEKISELEPNKIEALFQIVDALKNL